VTAKKSYSQIKLGVTRQHMSDLLRQQSELWDRLCYSVWDNTVSICERLKAL
jgi:hypothetical protein